MKTQVYYVRFSEAVNIPTAYCLPADVGKLEVENMRLREALRWALHIVKPAMAYGLAVEKDVEIIERALGDVDECGHRRVRLKNDRSE